MFQIEEKAEMEVDMEKNELFKNQFSKPFVMEVIESSPIRVNIENHSLVEPSRGRDLHVK